MDCSTVKRAAILIYIRGQRPAVNHHSECICYLHDKPGAGKRCRQRMPLREGGRTNSDFNPESRRPETLRVMKRGRRAGPNGLQDWCLVSFLIPACSCQHDLTVRTEGYANTSLYKIVRPLWITLHAQKAVNRSSRLWFMDSDAMLNVLSSNVH